MSIPYSIDPTEEYDPNSSFNSFVGNAFQISGSKSILYNRSIDLAYPVDYELRPFLSYVNSLVGTLFICRHDDVINFEMPLLPEDLRLFAGEKYTKITIPPAFTSGMPFLRLMATFFMEQENNVRLRKRIPVVKMKVVTERYEANPGELLHSVIEVIMPFEEDPNYYADNSLVNFQPAILLVASIGLWFNINMSNPADSVFFSGFSHFRSAPDAIQLDAHPWNNYVMVSRFGTVGVREDAEINGKWSQPHPHWPWFGTTRSSFGVDNGSNCRNFLDVSYHSGKIGSGFARLGFGIRSFSGDPAVVWDTEFQRWIPKIGLNLSVAVFGLNQPISDFGLIPWSMYLHGIHFYDVLYMEMILPEWNGLYNRPILWESDCYAIFESNWITTFVNGRKAHAGTATSTLLLTGPDDGALNGYKMQNALFQVLATFRNNSICWVTDISNNRLRT